MAKTKKETGLALPRSIRVTDHNWRQWQKEAEACGTTVSGWLHLLATAQINFNKPPVRAVLRRPRKAANA